MPTGVKSHVTPSHANHSGGRSMGHTPQRLEALCGTLNPWDVDNRVQQTHPVKNLVMRK
jgi:hypothetical protein